MPPPPFQLVRTADHEAMSQVAAARIVAQLRRKPDSLLILASGDTPERAYQLLAEHGRAEPGERVLPGPHRAELSSELKQHSMMWTWRIMPKETRRPNRRRVSR